MAGFFGLGLGLGLGRSVFADAEKVNDASVLAFLDAVLFGRTFVELKEDGVEAATVVGTEVLADEIGGKAQ